MIEFNFVTVLEQWPMLLRGLILTVTLTAFSAVLGALLGTACAWARLHGGPILKRVVGAYVELVRNTPFIIQLFFIFFGLPSLGLRLSVEVACVLAMVLNLGAYACEIVRAGLQTTPPTFESPPVSPIPREVSVRGHTPGAGVSTSRSDSRPGRPP